MSSLRTIGLCAATALLLTAAPATAAQRVFVSSTTSAGNLGGLDGADATCQQLANAEGLGGLWVAWLSIANVDAIDRLKGNGPFVLVGTNEVVATSRAQLTSGNLQNDIERTESGTQVPASVWTGTDPDGTAAASNSFCSGWTDATNGSFGQTGFTQETDADWTNANQIFCNLDARLYCFEQAASAAPVVSWTGLAALVAVLSLAGMLMISRRPRSASPHRLV